MVASAASRETIAIGVPPFLAHVRLVIGAARPSLATARSEGREGPLVNAVPGMPETSRRLGSDYGVADSAMRRSSSNETESVSRRATISPSRHSRLTTPFAEWR